MLPASTMNKVAAKPEQAFAHVHAFAKALRTPAALVKSMGRPFLFASTNKVKMCEGAFSSDEEIIKWLECFAKDWKILSEEAREAGVQNLKPFAFGGLPPFARRVFKDSQGAEFFYGWINGDGISFQLVFRIAPDKKVNGFAVDEEVVE